MTSGITPSGACSNKVKFSSPRAFCRPPGKPQEKAFQLIKEQHLEQLPMHEFLMRIRAQLLWAWARLDEAEASARSGIDVLSAFQPQQQLQCLALLVQCSLARGDLDNARTQLNRLENLLGNGQYHSDWISNADKVRVIYWQMTGDKKSAANWLRHTPKPEFANNHFLQGQWRNIARAQILLGEFESAEIVLEELNENARSLRLMSDLNRNLLLLNQPVLAGPDVKTTPSGCCLMRCNWRTVPVSSATL
ncbi:transcriptional regulator MalT [Citrobacter koseri]|uniref:Transcriptional regulator MalT n=1 Tax=Citrobacter koseri TaxID=545 RepID=A0A2X2W952_CITKO|nr:transcriptional regulator MalT [Citrobacter koseri]